MTIELLTQEEYDKLLEIQKNYPKLTFQNKGFEYINKPELSEDDKVVYAKVGDMLSRHIKGFVQFNNFRIGTDRISQKEHLCVRFQYQWDADAEIRTYPFTGVGYLTFEELLNGVAAETEPTKETI